MNNIDRRNKQYNRCKVIERIGYVLIILSIVFMVGFVGTYEMYDEIGQSYQLSKTVVQLIICTVVLFLGVKISRKGRELADFYIKEQKNRICEALDIAIKALEK